MLSSFTIRQAKSTDVQTLIQIRRTAWLETYQNIAPRHLISWWMKHDPTNWICTLFWNEISIISLEGEIIGFLLLRQNEIVEIWVIPEYQRKQAGSILVSHAESIAQSAGYHSVTMKCLNFNIIAREFFKSLGFIEMNRSTKLHKSNVNLIIVHMEKTISKLINSTLIQSTLAINQSNRPTDVIANSAMNRQMNLEK